MGPHCSRTKSKPLIKIKIVEILHDLKKKNLHDIKKKNKQEFLFEGMRNIFKLIDKSTFKHRVNLAWDWSPLKVRF
jgi:hypothetical protein